MAELLAQLVTHFGLPGVFIGYLIWQLHRKEFELKAKDSECRAEREAKDRAIAAESAARIADAKSANSMALEIQENTHKAIDKLAAYAELIERSAAR